MQSSCHETLPGKLAEGSLSDPPGSAGRVNPAMPEVRSGLRAYKTFSLRQQVFDDVGGVDAGEPEIEALESHR